MVDTGCNVLWRTRALEASINRQSLVAARGAEGVPRVPVEQVAGLGIDGRWRMSVNVMPWV